MAVCVKSEIGALKKVLLQRPGRELEHLSPNTLEELLFDDIPYLYGAQQEHDCFAAILREQGAEVVYLEDLTAEVLRLDPALRESFIQDVVTRAGGSAIGYRAALSEFLSAIRDEKELVQKTMEGVTYAEIFPGRSDSLASMVGTRSRFLMPPIPNLYLRATRLPASDAASASTTCTPPRATARPSTADTSSSIIRILRARCRFTTRLRSRSASRAATF